MSRKRMIDPAMWSDEGFLDLSIPARLMFVGLISHADDEGRGTASFNSLRARIFPGDAMPDDQLAAMKAEVQSHTRCTFYQVAGTEYYQLHRWHDYQKMRQTADSTIPPCDEPVPNHCVTGAEPLEHKEKKEGVEGVEGEEGVYGAKRPYAEHVSLTPEEHEALVVKHGADVVALAIELLDAYKLEKGKHYKSDAGALKSWGIQAALERREKQRKSGAAPPRAGRVCPKCGEVNRHNGPDCLKCRTELPRGKG